MFIEVFIFQLQTSMRKEKFDGGILATTIVNRQVHQFCYMIFQVSFRFNVYIDHFQHNYGLCELLICRMIFFLQFDFDVSEGYVRSSIPMASTIKKQSSKLWSTTTVIPIFETNHGILQLCYEIEDRLEFFVILLSKLFTISISIMVCNDHNTDL